MQDEVLATLRGARALIAHPDNWIKGAEARDSESNDVEAESESATCFCTVGALHRAMVVAGKGDNVELYMEAQGQLIRHRLESGGLVFFNDDPTTTHADVLDMFDRAIAELEKNSTSPKET